MYDNLPNASSMAEPAKKVPFTNAPVSNCDKSITLSYASSPASHQYVSPPTSDMEENQQAYFECVGYLDPPLLYHYAAFPSLLSSSLNEPGKARAYHKTVCVQSAYNSSMIID